MDCARGASRAASTVRGARVRSGAGGEFFRKQIRGKLPQAPLISNEAGAHWTDQQWCDGIARAITTANTKAKKRAQRIPAGASAYAFRHTRISELLQTY